MHVCWIFKLNGCKEYIYRKHSIILFVCALTYAKVNIGIVLFEFYKELNVKRKQHKTL